jgi:hypothetical protein
MNIIVKLFIGIGKIFRFRKSSEAKKVNAPGDAINTFTNSGLDLLVMDRFVVTKT